MLIVIGLFIATFLACLAFVHWHPLEDTTWISDLIGSVMVALAVSLFLGLSAWSILYVTLQDEVEVRWNLAEGPNGRYLENGVTGEYNDPTILAYYPEGDGIRQFYRYASNSAVATSPNGSAYALLTCPSPTTLPEWLKRPWGEDTDIECANEFITYYIPEGEQ